MKKTIGLSFLVLYTLLTQAQIFNGTLRPHPENGRYFTDNSGKAVYLTGSHTWANFQETGISGAPLFDWPGYLEMMQENNHNFMRLWVWEQARRGAWTRDDIVFSPLPYQTVSKKGKTLYDLSKFNESYFTRLRKRVEEAGQRGMYVSVMMFQGWSLNKTKIANGDSWEFHPFNPLNNINGVGGEVLYHWSDKEGKATPHSMQNGNILDHQEAYVTKVIETLNDFDNVLYEIINEGGTVEWQYHMIKFIKKAELAMPKQHPVGMTACISNNQVLWDSPADWISPAKQPWGGGTYIENYEEDPPANPGGKVVILDTDHLWGGGGNYIWAWKSFTRGHQPIFMDPWQPMPGRVDKEKMYFAFISGGISKVTRDYPDNEPLRKNLGYIKKLAGRIDLINMKPANHLSSTSYCLANPGKEYVIFFPSGGDAIIDLRGGQAVYDVEWFIPILNRTILGDEGLQGGGLPVLTAPFTGNVVLYLKRQESN